jgi:hypothetical protein
MDCERCIPTRSGQPIGYSLDTVAVIGEMIECRQGRHRYQDHLPGPH